MRYSADEKRYDRMGYCRCGRSGLMLPRISLGLWHNFGASDPFDVCQKMLFRAFDLGITHFDLANNYGPPEGAAEETLGKILKSDLKRYRDELIISTKACHLMWKGPYGEWGSRKHLLASLDQSLKRLGVDYVDIFYLHRPDPNTPIEESLGAVADAVKRGKALYAGISKHDPEQTMIAADLLREMSVPCVIHQCRYSMLLRKCEEGLFDVIEEKGLGCIVFSVLAQGLLTDRYLKGIPEGSRAVKDYGTLRVEDVSEETVAKALSLEQIAGERGQSLAQMAIAWALRDERVTSAIVGTSSVKQIEENVAALDNLEFSCEQLEKIDQILNKQR